MYHIAVSFDVHVKGPHFARFFDIIQTFAEGPTWLIKGARINDNA
ncbi:hypothetical protein [Streptosporangium minutum]|nr:hypothetical protein [Streptosporangium minutum]